SDPTSTDTLDFFGLVSPVKLDLTIVGLQTIAAGFLAIDLADPARIENAVGTVFADRLFGNAANNRIVGGGGSDFVYGDDGDDYLTAARTRFVYLDFDSQTGTGNHVYTQTERDAIEARMQQDFAAFDVQLSQSPPSEEVFITVLFNSAPIINGREVSGGASERIGFRDVERGGTVQVDVNNFIGSGTNQLPEEEDSFVALSSTIASHELAHMYGVRHQDAFGSPVDGVFAGLNRAQAFLPAFGGPTLANETSQHLIASPASVGTTLADALGNPFFGEREALKLTLGETGVSTIEQATATKSGSITIDGVARVAQEMGPLTAIAVPNTIEDPTAKNFGKTLTASVHNVLGQIDLVGPVGSEKSENDLYSFAAFAGDLITVEVYSSALRSRIDNTIDSLVRVFDATGTKVPYYGSALGAFNDDGFEPTDSVLLNLPIPATGTYYVEVDTFNFGIDEFSTYVPDFDAVDFCDGRVGDVRCDDTDTGGYELLLYRFDNTPLTPAVGDVLVGGLGVDTLITSSGTDTFLVEPNDVDSIGGPSAPENLIINVAPTLTAIADQTVAVNQPLTFTAVGSDDNDHDLLKYEVLPPVAGVFPAGALIDEETGVFTWTPTTPGTYDLIVSVSDLHRQAVVDAVSITVTGSSTLPPSDIALSASVVNENSQVDVVVGSVVVTDPDAGDTHTLTLVDDAGGRFVLDGDQIKVAAGAVLNFENAAAHDIVIKAIDSGGLQLEKTLSIDLADVPDIESVEIGDGTAQRSVIRQMTVTFDGVVTILPDAFEIRRRPDGTGNGGGIVESTYTRDDSSGKTVLTFTFSGDFTRAPTEPSSALVDGNYELIIFDSKVSRGGDFIDGNFDGVAGGSYSLGDEATDNFYAQYGDVSGDRQVLLADFIGFRATYGTKEVEHAAYKNVFDYDDDKDVDLRDYLFFRKGYGVTVTFE
ncbi:MAG: putative Ig domain-containing protein, partial [Pirellulaceae bacterium]